MQHLNRFLFQIGLRDLRTYHCRQCGNPYLSKDKAPVAIRICRLISGYEMVDCLICNTRWRVPRLWKKAS